MLGACCRSAGSALRPGCLGARTSRRRLTPGLAHRGGGARARMSRTPRRRTSLAGPQRRGRRARAHPALEIGAFRERRPRRSHRRAERRLAASVATPAATGGRRRGSSRRDRPTRGGSDALLPSARPTCATAIRALTPDCPQAHWFEREIAEQWGVAPRGIPGSSRSASIRRIGPGTTRGRASRCDPAGRHRLLPRRGRRGARGRRRPGARRRHRAGPLPLPVPRRARASPRDRARLPAPRRRAGARRRPDEAHASTTWRRSPATPRSATRPPTARRSKRSPACRVPRARRGAARHRARARAARQPHRRPRRAGGRRRLPADRLVLRPHPRRLPEHDGAALRQPLRPRPGPPRRRRASTSTRRAPPSCCERLDAARSRDVDRRRRAAVGHAVGAWRGSRTPASSRARRCEALGLVGPAARACGLERDVRHDSPSGHLSLRADPGLDLAQRRRLRARLRALARDPALGRVRRASSSTRCPAAPVARARRRRWRRDTLAVSLVEGWRGEICHVAITDARGPLRALQVVDPSFHNWIGLAMALRDQQISDFPLCNKSFNLSYCGHDL